MPLTISIRPGTDVTIHKQIVEQVCAAVYAGQIADDEPLPSVRALAEQLVINPNTVARAYGELIREGVIESHPGRGTFVAERRQIYSRAERTRRVAERVTSLVTEALTLGFTVDEIVEEVEAAAKKLDPKARAKGASRLGKPNSDGGRS